MTPEQIERTEILRRIGERGLSKALSEQDDAYVDLFQHLLNEIELLRRTPIELTK